MCSVCEVKSSGEQGALRGEVRLDAGQRERLRPPTSGTASTVTRGHVTVFQPVGLQGKGSKLLPTWSPLSR